MTAYLIGRRGRLTRCTIVAPCPCVEADMISVLLRKHTHWVPKDKVITEAQAKEIFRERNRAKVAAFRQRLKESRF